LRLTPAQRTAAEQAWRAAAALLESGAQGAALVLTAELLRAVHSCRVARLPRLSAAGVRVAQHLRDLHAERPEFRLASLSSDIQQLLETAHALRTAGETVDSRWIGEARRGYAEVGSLHLLGLCCEAVVSSTGYAGVVSYLLDQSGVIWSLGDVAPGDAQRCRFVYGSPIPLADATLDHRALCRAGLDVERATAAANRRLGAGQGVSAADAEGSLWSAPPLAGLWGPLEPQLERAWAARSEDQHRAGDDWLFLRGTLAGASSDGVLLRVDGITLNGSMPSAHRELSYRHNLGLLAHAVGLGVWAIGRVAFARPRTVFLLAIGGEELRLPEAWLGRVNLGLDRLEAKHLPAADQTTQADAQRLSAGHVDPLEPLRRRLQQIVLGGRGVTSSVAASGFARDEARLASTQLPTAALLLRRLRQASEQDLADAWLAARIYLHAAETHLQRQVWLG
jgi:hypothetical protein